ncbi:MAG: DUF362 domain-containing protein, partial [Muribaculaceae bacterium]|nr:DUF362 domain-containing protein [Muribaculaceae bacterium]
MKVKVMLAALAGLSMSMGCCAQDVAPDNAANAVEGDVSVVYMTREITPDSIIKLYNQLGREAKGKVAVKISTGEPGGHNYLKPELIGPFVQSVNGTIVECNTAYAGKRYTAEDHLLAAADHGFTAIAPVDIMDAG